MTRFKATAGAIVVLVGFFTATLPGRQSGSEALVHADLQAYMNARTAGFSGITNFSFGVYSDIHMCECSINVLTRAQWAGLLTTWRDVGNLFGVIVGDLGYDELSHRDNVLSGPAAVPSAPPVFYAMGNHENTIRSASGPGSTRCIRTPYGQRAGRRCRVCRPGNADHAYWSFNVGPSTHFIFLDGGYMTWDGINGPALANAWPGATHLAEERHSRQCRQEHHGVRPRADRSTDDERDAGLDAGAHAHRPGGAARDARCASEAEVHLLGPPPQPRRHHAVEGRELGARPDRPAAARHQGQCRRRDDYAHGQRHEHGDRLRCPSHESDRADRRTAGPPRRRRRGERRQYTPPQDGPGRSGERREPDDRTAHAQVRRHDVVLAPIHLGATGQDRAGHDVLVRHLSVRRGAREGRRDRAAALVRQGRQPAPADLRSEFHPAVAKTA